MLVIKYDPSPGMTPDTLSFTFVIYRDTSGRLVLLALREAGTVILGEHIATVLDDGKFI